MTVGLLGIESGDFTIKYGSRVVTTSQGTLICLSPTLQEYSMTFEYPDPTKDIAYAYQQYRQWVYTLTDNGYKNRYRVIQTCQSVFTRAPEETSLTQDVDTAPDGADIFVGQVKLNRTTNPTHPWFDTTLSPRQKTNSWIPWNGSGLLEASLGLTRLLHLFIHDGHLLLEAQQSVLGAAGGFSNAGTLSWGGSNSTETSREIRETTTRGTPVWTSTSSPYRKSQEYDSGFTDFGPPSLTSNQTAGLRKGNAGECSQTDPTNYRSVYSINIRGWFGKRSIDD